MAAGKKILHVAIIPDRNRRWAKTRGLPYWKGHEAGYASFKKILTRIWDFEVTHFTFWALSIDNLQKRGEDELRALTRLCKLGISELKMSPEFKSRDVRFKTIGRWKDFFPEFEPDIKELEESSRMRNERTFTLALAYDGLEEDKEQKDAIRKNVPPSMPLTPAIENEHLWSGFLPDVDLCIRTGGEPHLSAGFLMHKMANAYLAFPGVYWPDFSPRHLKKIIDDFRSHERRFGA